LIKSSLAKWGKPTQFLLVEKYESLSKRRELKYYLSNLALAIYAKAGGKPWALDIDSANNFIAEGSDLILGVGGTRVDGRNWFAFTTLFERNGTFDYWSSDITSQEEYVQSLKKQIKTSIDDYIREHPGEEIKTITFHIAGKKPGRKEQYAVKEAMQELGTNFNYALLHINTTSPFWVLDDKFITPPDGLKVYLTYKDFLIVPEGRREDELPRRRLVRPLRVTVIDCTVPDEQIDTLIKEIYGLTRMNWRGFNACKIPVSVYYPRLLAFSLFQLRSNPDIETFESITHQVSLRRKPWFL
jgi:argonaute-like protein implicated in RNA metabolism and viral defense